MIPKIDLPVMLTKVYYIGNDTELHKKGNQYTVIESGFHWMKELGYVIWVTTDEHPDTRDYDCGMSFKPEDFDLYFRCY